MKLYELFRYWTYMNSYLASQNAPEIRTLFIKLLEVSYSVLIGRIHFF